MEGCKIAELEYWSNGMLRWAGTLAFPLLQYSIVCTRRGIARPLSLN